VAARLIGVSKRQRIPAAGEVADTAGWNRDVGRHQPDRPGLAEPVRRVGSQHGQGLPGAAVPPLPLRPPFVARHRLGDGEVERQRHQPRQLQEAVETEIEDVLDRPVTAEERGALARGLAREAALVGVGVRLRIAGEHRGQGRRRHHELPLRLEDRRGLLAGRGCRGGLGPRRHHDGHGTPRGERERERHARGLRRQPRRADQVEKGEEALAGHAVQALDDELGQPAEDADERVARRVFLEPRRRIARHRCVGGHVVLEQAPHLRDHVAGRARIDGRRFERHGVALRSR
jgi:hypothetical protein